MNETKKTYKEMYLEQNEERNLDGYLKGDLAILFDIIHPYQMWSELDTTKFSMKVSFKERYEPQLHLFFDNPVT